MTRERLPWLMAALTLLFHALANPHYGFFRDELYFIICGRHPALGYVDQPPLVPLLAAGSQVFGPSLLLLRLIPALCAAGAVYVTCLLVREMRGGAYAQVLAGVTVLLAPVLAAFGGQLSTDSLQLVLWPLIALFALRVCNGASPRWWLAAGAAAGLAFEAKYSVVFFVTAMLAGIAFSPQRRVLFSKWFAAGIALAAVIALPNVLWQAHAGFPMLEVLRNGQLGKNVVLSPLAYAAQQLALMNPVLSLVWLAGLVLLLREAALRWIAYGYLLLITAMILTHGKDYYPAAVYPILIAAGGCAIERWTVRAVALRPVAAVAATAFGLMLIPMALPVLPERAFIAYEKALHLSASASEHHEMRDLPQEFADMHGWPEFAAAAGGAYDALPPQERRQAVVVTGNYGEAAAIEFFDPHVPVVSGHNQYWLWGPRGFSGAVVVDASGGDCGRDRGYFRDIRPAATFSSPYVMAYEDKRAIEICRKPARTLQQIWPELKNYE